MTPAAAAAAVAGEPRINRVDSTGQHTEIRVASDQRSAHSESAGLEFIAQLPAK